MKRDLRQFKKEQAREALVNAALKLFFKKGFDATTVEEIAEQAVVSRRTFFRYFEGKEAVLVAWMDDMGARIQVDLKDNLTSQQPYEALEKAILTAAKGLLANMDYAVALSRLIYKTPSIRSFHAHKYSSWEKGFAEIISKGKTSAKAHLEARLLAARAIDALRISLDIWADGDFKGDLKSQMERAFQIARDAVE